MKCIISLILLTAMVLGLFSGCSRFSKFKETDDGLLTLTRGEITVKVDPVSGMLKEVSSAYDTIRLDRLLVDVGLREQFIL